MPPAAQAHRVNIFAWTEGPQVVAECGFSGGNKVRQGQMTVFDAVTGAKLLEGRTDDQGVFRFAIPDAGRVHVTKRDAAGKAARRASVEDITALRRRLDDLRDAVESRAVERYAKADAAFHTHVMVCAGNALAAEIHAHLGEALGVNVVADGWDQPAAERQLRLHAELVEAIAARDGALAERCARRLGAGKDDA